VPAGDVDALAERIRRLHDDAGLRTALAASARRRAESFGWPTRYRRMGLVYRHILRGPQPATGDCIDLTER
jgi:glycosyltransferase involved in cell wall biosynthesis